MKNFIQYRDFFYFNIANCKGLCEFLNPSVQNPRPLEKSFLKKINDNNNKLKIKIIKVKNIFK